MEEPKQIAFIGLGAMGAPMAAHLVRAGHRVTAYNRTHSRAQAWLDPLAETGGDIAVSPAQAAAGADIVITCVGDDPDLEDVLLKGEGALAAMAPGALLIDHTTVSAGLARAIAGAAEERGVRSLDAPVSGGESGAQAGKLSVMCGGSVAAFAAAEPIMQAYAARIVHVGGDGAGQTAKMANQIAIAGTLAGLAEAVRFTQAAGIAGDKVFEAISCGAAQSWQMDNRWATMMTGDFDFGFAIDWMRKDLGFALAEARRLGTVLPVAALVDQFYGEVQARGGARQDTSALIRHLPDGQFA